MKELESRTLPCPFTGFVSDPPSLLQVARFCSPQATLHKECCFIGCFIHAVWCNVISLRRPIGRWVFTQHNINMMVNLSSYRALLSGYFQTMSYMHVLMTPLSAVMSCMLGRIPSKLHCPAFIKVHTHIELSYWLYTESPVSPVGPLCAHWAWSEVTPKWNWQHFFLLSLHTVSKQTLKVLWSSYLSCRHGSHNVHVSITPFHVAYLVIT